MSIAAMVRQTPLWMIFVGLFALMLAPQPAFWSTRDYTTSRGCKVKTHSIGAPPIYTIRLSSCSGRTSAWHWGAISAVGGIALTIAGVLTNTLAERRRGASWKQQWLTALIGLLVLAGVTFFAAGLGSSINCRNAEGMCGLGVLVGGSIGLASATLGLLVAGIAWRQISRLTRIAAVAAIPGTLALAIIAGIIGALLGS